MSDALETEPAGQPIRPAPATTIGFIRGIDSDAELDTVDILDLVDLFTDEGLPARAIQVDDEYVRNPDIGGAPGVTETTISVWLHWLEPYLLGGAAITLAGLLTAAGEDLWKALKRGVACIRRHPNQSLAQAHIDLIIQVVPPPRHYVWIYVPDGSVSSALEALEALEDFPLEVALDTKIYIRRLRWNETTKQWTYGTGSSGA